VVNVPMLKENELVGAISIYHQEVRPFTERQIELVSNFANQAVVAIEIVLRHERRRLTEPFCHSRLSKSGCLAPRLEQHA
jgi:GAF domain-containing protein